MFSEEHTISSRQSAKRELDSFKQDLLPVFLPLLPLAAWFWAYYLSAVYLNDPVNPLPMIALVLLAYPIWRLRKNHYQISVFLLLFGLVLAYALLVRTTISPMIAAFGVLIIIVANALVNPLGAFLATIGTWAVSIVGAPMNAFIGTWHVDVLIFYLIVWLVLSLSVRPLHKSVVSALEGWEQARKALLEVRQRRAELYSALRSLEEATYRIERLNNELILAQRDAEAARANKARFVATVSHELRNPLNLILGFSRMIMMSPEKYGEPLPAAYRADIDVIYRNSQYLATLVDDVLDLSQIDAGKLPLVKDNVRLQEDIVERVIDILMPLAKRKGLEWSCPGPPSRQPRFSWP